MRRASRGAAIASAAVAAFCLGMALAGGGTTYASLSDLDSVHASAHAAVWGDDLPNAPEECDDVLKRPHAELVYGTEAGESLPRPGVTPPDGNHPQVIMALGGDDSLLGGNQKDCLVGGPGNDRLIGGDGKDHLDGGAGWDVCEGENGKDTFVGCERITDPGTAYSAAPDTAAEISPTGTPKDSPAGHDTSGGTTGKSSPPPAQASPSAPAQPSDPSAQGGEQETDRSPETTAVQSAEDMSPPEQPSTP